MRPVSMTPMRIESIAATVTATMALVAVGWGAFVYVNDIQYMVANVSVRNISYYRDKICSGKADDMVHEQFQDELARYERYMGRPHRYATKLGCLT